MKFWQRLFTAFLQRFHLMRFFGRNRSFKELHQSSYAQEISKIYLCVCSMHQEPNQVIY